MYDKDRIKEDLSVIDAAEYLGVKMAPGSRVQRKILCPAHNDRHFGSCIVKEKRWRCFACGAEGDVFNFIMTVENCDFSHAIEIAAECTGNPNRYLIEQSDNPKKETSFKKELNCPITTEDLKTLGLLKSVRIPIERMVCYKGEDLLGEKYICDDFSPNDNELVVAGNYETENIFDFYEEDPESFFFMIEGTASQKILTYGSFLEEGVNKFLPMLSPEYIYEFSTYLKREIVKLKNILKKCMSYTYKEA